MNNDFVIRKFQWDDLPALVALYNAADKADREERHVSVEQLQHLYKSPGFDVEANDFLAFTEAGQLVGVCNLYLVAADGACWSGGQVHPDYRQKGLGTKLIRRAEARFLERAQDEVEPDKPLYMILQTSEFIPGAQILFEKMGYEVVRRTYSMRITLDDTLKMPVMPEGLTLRPFDRERDSHAVYVAFDEIFREHWGYYALGHKEWEHRMFNNPEHDPELFIIAVEGDEIAGINLCRRWGEGIPDMGWVESLGVRPAWRRRGLGKALLLHSFHRFKKMGVQRAALQVDASSKTNAVTLYQQAGMYINKQILRYRKIFRGQAEDIQD